MAPLSESMPNAKNTHVNKSLDVNVAEPCFVVKHKANFSASEASSFSGKTILKNLKIYVFVHLFRIVTSQPVWTMHLHFFFQTVWPFACCVFHVLQLSAPQFPHIFPVVGHRLVFLHFRMCQPATQQHLSNGRSGGRHKSFHNKNQRDMDQNLLPPQMESEVILTFFEHFLGKTRNPSRVCFRVFGSEPIWFLPLVWATRRNSHQWYVRRPRLPIKTQKDHIHMSLFVLSCVFFATLFRSTLFNPADPCQPQGGCVREKVSCWSELQASFWSELQALQAT